MKENTYAGQRRFPRGSDKRADSWGVEMGGKLGSSGEGEGRRGEESFLS